MKKLATLNIILFFVFTLSSPAYAGSLFKKKIKKNSNPAENTFIYWINGDAERFRPAKGLEKKVVRVDKQDVADVREAAKTCECNVVLAYDQRGTDRWYTKRTAWGAYLEVYSRGKRIFKRSAAEVNQADPSFLKNLLVFTEESFPESKIHLIYRGHSFFVPYDATVKDSKIAPFDYSHKGSSYSVDTFSKSLEMAKLQNKLSSITFASCTMSYLDVILKTSEYTKFLIASQIPILETGTAGFDLSFITKVNHDAQTEEEIVDIIASNLLNKFKQTKYNEDIIRETIITKINLIDFEDVRHRYVEIAEYAKESFKEEGYKDVGVTVRPSQAYIDKKLEAGVGSKTIEILKTRVNFDKLSSTADLGRLLSLLSPRKTYFVRNDLEKRMEIINYSDFSKKTGINLSTK